ncbi:glycosyltransferase family 4 protein [Halorarum halophilum]|uniref:Glycosyltransferase family 4 protein n=1 Tax=Halorarum halophilum TaxID=2743090 RepID=A0A7D5GD38_9EURY|nr:glycosyltransferase family 4 protein [Halobaculum halophilum]QLG28686.1 glycosyltransferase family 4 protein [Halobaculum halophilum]
MRDELARRDVDVVTVPYNRGDIRNKNEKGILTRPAEIAANIPTVVDATRSLYELIRDRNIDIVHTNSFKSAVLVSFPARITGTPLLFHARSSRAYSDHGILDRYVCESADRIIANSEFTASTYSPWSEKTTVIYNGVNTDVFDPAEVTPRDIIAEHDLRNDQPVIGTVGRLTPRKRQIDLVRALPEIQKSHPDVQVLFVGGSYKGLGTAHEREIAATMRELGVEDCITFTGYVDDVHRYLAAFDVSVLPSLKEPFGRVVVESLLMETPVVGTADGGIPEIVTHGETGYLVPPEEPRVIADSVTRLLDNPSRMTEFGQRGREESLERFDAATITEQEQAVYHDVLAL